MELDRSILHLKFSRGVSADSAGRARDGGMGGGGGGGAANADGSVRPLIR